MDETDLALKLFLIVDHQNGPAATVSEAVESVVRGTQLILFPSRLDDLAASACAPPSFVSSIMLSGSCGCLGRLHITGEHIARDELVTLLSQV